jgi:hypothetical protein
MIGNIPMNQSMGGKFDARMTPMILLYGLAAVGAAVIMTAWIWHEVDVQTRIRTVKGQLAKMRKEIEVLRMQESRRLMLALKGNSDMEAPSLVPDERLISKPRPHSAPLRAAWPRTARRPCLQTMGRTRPAMRNAAAALDVGG